MQHMQHMKLTDTSYLEHIGTSSSCYRHEQALITTQNIII